MNHKGSDTDVPRISLDLTKKRASIAVAWSILFVTSGLLPVVLYFGLRYGTSLKLSIVLAIPTAIFGVSSLYNFFNRVYKLTRKDPFYRPLGCGRWQLDVFQWNFNFSFIYITAFISAGDSIADTHPHLAVRLLSMPLALLLCQVSIETLLAALLGVLDTTYPFQMSSMAKGTATRPAVYTIIEDVCAVDGGQGETFRKAFDARYRASGDIILLLKTMDWMWGVSGLCIAVALLAVIWTLDDPDVGFALGWLLPWAWAALMAFITIQMTRAAKRREDSRLLAQSSG